MSSRWWRGAPFLLPLAVLLWAVLRPQPAAGIPAFARKYGLPCSACHEAWPMLNVFGQTFKDNGYQLMNDRDAPIWQTPGYWPATFRITPAWHRESSNKTAIDTAAGPNTAEVSLVANGFDTSGLDFHTGGTLAKNFSFYVLPSSDPTGAFHFETVMARVDNLFGSSWLNLKMGKFELDNLISEKRILTLSNDGGFYNIYHFVPVGDTNIWGQVGDNQFGAEVMGHSADDRTRYSVALLSSNDGNVNLPNRNAYSVFATASQAFDMGYDGGINRVGAYYFGGDGPTFSLTSGGVPILGVGNKGFHREGLFALLYLKKLDFQMFYQHGWDSAYFGTATPSNMPLPAGARSPTWNGGFVESHYVHSPQLIFIQRAEFIRMANQALPVDPLTGNSNPSRGNLDSYTFGYRWYPIMNSRAGFAWHNEYSLIRTQGLAPLSFTSLTTSSVYAGFDFAF